MTYDFLVTGAGFSGCVLAERIASQLGKTVLVIEKREHIGGNAYDYFDQNGILVHKYGPHIFHTNSKKVWEYLSLFTEWRAYEHKVLAMVQGTKVPIPFNLNSLYACFPDSHASLYEKRLVDGFGVNAAVPILKLRESKDLELKKLADFVYDNVFHGYTVKQWGQRPEQLDASVTARVPILVSRDDRYFRDVYQAIPKYGYTKMFEKMISHPKIHVEFNVDFKDMVSNLKFDKMIYTGPIDYFFDFIFGMLEYRSLDFRFETLGHEQFQEVAQVNYPNDHDYTRITEFKFLTGQRSPKTTIAYEYPTSYASGFNEPYYPVPREGTMELYRKYLDQQRKISKSVKFIGRLAEYKYYNMDQAVARALAVFERDISTLYA